MDNTETTNKIGMCGPNKLMVTLDGQIGSFHMMMHRNSDNEDALMLGLCQLKRKAGPACREGLLTNDDFPDVRSDATPYVFFDFVNEASIDVVIKMLENYRKQRFPNN